MVALCELKELCYSIMGGGRNLILLLVFLLNLFPLLLDFEYLCLLLLLLLPHLLPLSDA